MSEIDLGFRHVTLKNGQLIIDRQIQLPIDEREKHKRFKEWFERDVEPAMVPDIQVRINNFGAQVARRAGMNVEDMAHELEADATGNSLEDILTSSNGYHFTVDAIMRGSIDYVRELERTSGQKGWGNAYLRSFVERLADARNISETTKKQLYGMILQPRLSPHGPRRRKPSIT